MGYEYDRLWDGFYREFARVIAALDVICEANRGLEQKMIHLGQTMNELKQAEVHACLVFELASNTKRLAPITRTSHEASYVASNRVLVGVGA